MARSAIATAALALAVVTASLGGCQDPTGPRSDPGAHRDRPIRAGDAYVALGDSYTAAYRTGPTDERSGRCLRSLRNYPRLLAEELDLRLTDVSCGGATTDAGLSPQQWPNGDSVPPQAQALDEQTDLVTISLGANDHALFTGLVVTCVQLAVDDPDGRPCSDLVAQDPGRADRQFAEITRSVAALVRAAASAAPEARIVVVGYPRIFPEQGPCDQIPLASGDFALAYGVVDDINASLRAAAAETGTDFADLWSLTRGHDMCGEDPWIAGTDPTRDDGYPYHPFPEEQAAVADLLVAMVGS